MRVVTALGLLALAATAAFAQTAATVTNYPGNGERVTFVLDSNSPTTGAISLTDTTGTTWVAYGTKGGITWYNSSCVMQGLPTAATWSTTGCVMMTALPYPVTSLVKTGANTFVAVANDTVTLYTGMTATKSLFVPGTTFDLATVSYPNPPQPMSPTVWNNALYIGSMNVNGSGMSTVRKIDMTSGAVTWAAMAPTAWSNYPVSIATLSNGVTVAVVQSASQQDMMFVPFADSTGAAGNATLSIAKVENQKGCAYNVAGSYVCPQVQFATATVSGIFYIAATTLSAQLIAVDLTTGFFATVQTGLGGSGSQVLQAFGTWLFLGRGYSLYLLDTTKVPVSTLIISGGVIPGASYNSGNTVSLPSGSSYIIQAVIYANTTNTFWLIHSGGIATAPLSLFTSTTSGLTATVWWWYWQPFSSSVPSVNLQGAWVDAASPTMLYATWGSSSGTPTGSAWGFNMSSQQAVWRFGDNYDARGPAIWVPSTSVPSGLWFGVANAALSVYGRRVLLGWAVDSMGQLLPNVAKNYYSTYQANRMHMSYSNVSGLLAIVAAYPDNTFTLYNGTTMMVNASWSSSSPSFVPSQSIITVGTWHCASSSSSLYCLDWTTGKGTQFSFTTSIGNQPLVVANRYVLVHDSYTVLVLDTAATAPAFTTVGQATNSISGQLAGAINPTDNSLVIAVPQYTRVTIFYGIDGKTKLDVAYTSSTAGGTQPYFYSNALSFNGYLYVAGNVSITLVTGSTSSTMQYGQITRIPLSTAVVAKAVTATQAALWVMKGTNKVGAIANLFASPLYPTTVFTIGDTFTAWDTATGNTYFSVPPLATLSFYTASNSNGNYDYFPAVDPTTRGVIVGMLNTSNNVFMGWSILSSVDGTLLRFVGVPATASGTGINFVPQSTPYYRGNTLITTSTHMCEYSTVYPWNVSISPSTTDYFDARVCTTTTGTAPTYGVASIGDSFFLLINGLLQRSTHLAQSYQSIVPFVITGGPQATGSGNAPSDDSKTPVIIGVIIAIVLVAIIVVVVVKKVGGGGGSSNSAGGQGMHYNEMSGKGV